MGWQDLLAVEDTTLVLPWKGGRRVHSHNRTWNITGRTPREHGWYTFKVGGGRDCTLVGPADRAESYAEGHRLMRGFLVGDRLIPDAARVDPDPTKLIEQTEAVFCVDLGLDRFQKAAVIRDREGALIFLRLEWPEGPEADVLAAYQDRKDSVLNIKGVTPALDLAFRWVSFQRTAAEAHAIEMERRQKEEEAKLAAAERIKTLLKATGTAEGRRALAAQDFNAAAKAALRVSGAELLDVIATHKANEVRVQYRFRERRLECVVNKVTLGVIDAGVCLDDHRGTKGDTWFTLESLPGVIGEAMDRNKLVVWRHVEGDIGGRGNARDDYDDYDDD